MATKVRRVVTAQNAQGRSYILSDAIATNAQEMKTMTGLMVTDLWETVETPADNAGTADGAARPMRHEPPKAGTLFRFVEFPPDTVWRDTVDPDKAFGSIGGGHTRDKTSQDPLMHKSTTIDYIIVLKGEMYAVMDEGEVLLKPGDVLVQRGTNHSWSNRSDAPCLIAAILIDAKPI
jgi:mannose-6-phosphate isomerase-like protein (cupin superfamily)